MALRRALVWPWLAAGWLVRSLRARLRGAPGTPERDGYPDEDRDSATGRKPRVLWVCPYAIHPMSHGGAVRLGNLLRRVASEAEIDLLLWSGGNDEPAQREALAPYCRRIFVQQRPSSARTDPWGRMPYAMRVWGSVRIEHRIAALASAHEVDVVQLEFTELGQYARALEQVPVVLTEIDLAFRTAHRQQSLRIRDRYDGSVGTGDPGDGLRLFDHELAVCRGVDQIHCMSADDGRTLASLLPDRGARIRIVPNGVDTDRYRPPTECPEAPRVLFFGSFPHLPNRDALDFFVREVWPRVLAQRPRATLTVAGAEPPPEVLALGGRDNIVALGEVDDPAPLYRRHRLLVAPLRAGSGTRLKILEAFASGLPVVSTTIGVEGIDAVPGEHLLVADDPGALAEAVVRVLDDDALAGRLRHASRTLVEAHYGWDAIAARLAGHWRGLVDHRRADVEPEAPEPGVPGSGPVSPSCSVIVVADTDATPAAVERTVEGVRSQDTAAKTEILLVDVGAPGVAEAAAALGVVCIACGGRRGPHDVGASRSRGPVLVFLTAGLVPANEGWLRRLVAPFADPSPPAAVQGGVHERRGPGASQHWLRSTRETAGWRGAHGGLAFTLANAGLRREVWEAEPFGRGSTSVGRRWQWRTTHADLLILPLWDAEVIDERPWHRRAIWRRAVAEGRVSARLGHRYRLFDLVADLWHPGLYGPGGRRTSWRHVLGGDARYMPWLRPLGLWLGGWRA